MKSIRTLVATLALAAAILTGPSPVGAEAKKDVSAPGTGQVLLCQGGGGTAMVDEDRTGQGLNAVTVSCSGGTFGGLTCTNNQSGTTCTHKRAGSSGSGRAVATPSAGSPTQGVGDGSREASGGMVPMEDEL